MNMIKTTLLLLALSLFSAPLYAERNLDSKKAEKLEIRHSMIGFRNTLLFYTFKDQRAVLVLSIDNKDEKFPVTGRIHLFDEATTDDDLKKWLNNQHSDGLFTGVPKPILTEVLPEGTCTVTSHKKTGISHNRGNIHPNAGKYQDYEVTLTVKEHVVDEKFKLAAFADTARVHVKSK